MGGSRRGGGVEGSSLPVGDGAQDPLHHGQVLPVVVRLEQGGAVVQLKHDAADGPHVTRLGPTQFWNMHNNLIKQLNNNKVTAIQGQIHSNQKRSLNG